MDDRVCYFYYRAGKFNVTVAYSRNMDENAVLFGAAFCRKGDRFSKSLGKRIAVNRLNSVPAAVSLGGAQIDTPRRDVHERILEELVACDYAPARFSPDLTLKRFNTLKRRGVEIYFDIGEENERD